MPLIRFLFSHGASSLALGVHLVLLAWLSVDSLALSSTEFAWVQTMALLPSIGLTLLSGVWVDKYGALPVLFVSQVLLTLAYGFLAWVLISGGLSLETLLIYALWVGFGNGLMQPAREKLVTDVAALSLQKKISLASVIQFSMQSCGIALAALSDSLGVSTVVLIQVGIAFLGAANTFGLHLGHTVPNQSPSMLSHVASLSAGFRALFGHAALRQLMVLIGFNGHMHMGVFIVLMPILATESYQFTSAQYGGLQFVFVLGMISAHLGLLRKSTVQYPGQGALFSLLYTAVIGYALTKSPTVTGLYVLVFCWGLVAGNSAAQCRMVLQSLSAAELKGRLMSIYQFILFGAAPVGALTTGYFIRYLSMTEILYVMSLSSVGLFVLFMFSRSLWAVEQIES
ncbi:MAG: MFS transporter [Alteromonadaceae bacterium]|nr:MAG: MFS transporter [Alteromonadaceae bacterium]